MKSNVQIIKNKEIKYLNFPKEEVLSNKSEKINRFVKLHRALYLGNTDREKVRIVFYDDAGLKSIDTTISDIRNKFVIIKKAITIPLQRIVSVA